MRGKLSLLRTTPESDRITPADAGKTYIAVVFSVVVTDHPRGCGENCIGLETSNFVIGSPPRMRGKLDNAVCARYCGRITPADAGKTQ